MAHKVFLTDDAVRDLEDIVDYIADHDSPDKATRVQNRIEKAILGLANQPNRGNYPKELVRPLHNQSSTGGLMA